MEPNHSSQTAKPPNPQTIFPKPPTNQDFLTHLEKYLAKRDGVDKLLKITRYATKIILSSSILPSTLPLTHRLKSFESSIGTSRKAFRLGKFIQDINSLRTTPVISTQDQFLTLLAYGGEGLYYFVEQLVWFAKTGLIDSKHSSMLQKISAWTEFVGYFGSIGLKMRDLKGLTEAERRLAASVEIAELRGEGSEKEVKEMGKLKEKLLMKKLSIVQDFADGLMALADIRDGGRILSPLVLACAGLLSGLISTHKNWVSC